MIREAIVHHSVDGSLAIRQGKWKMIPQLGSGGWTKPTNPEPNANEPNGQLYDIEADQKETNNLWNEHLEVVEQLQALLEKYRSEDRSTNRKNQ